MSDLSNVLKMEIDLTYFSVDTVARLSGILGSDRYRFVIADSPNKEYIVVEIPEAMAVTYSRDFGLRNGNFYMLKLVRNQRFSNGYLTESYIFKSLEPFDWFVKKRVIKDSK